MPHLRLTAITPNYLPSTKQYMDAIYRAVDQTGNLVLRDLQSTVKTWNHKPTFYVAIHKTNRDYAIAAGTNNLIYLFVDGGTKAHIIRAKNSRYLAFQGRYTAKTRVGIIGSREGGPSGDMQFRQEVRHPGFPGRKFILTISKRRQTSLYQKVGHAIAEVNRLQK